MKIIVSFLSGSDYWRDKVLASAEEASQTLSNPAFLAKVRSWPGFDFCSDTSAQVADKLEQAGDVRVTVGFYSKWLTRAIAYENELGVHFNTRKESYGAGGAGDLAHELCHQLGYRHNGNALRGNENTVPWSIGRWVDEWRT